jgi:Domain of unknown function (DUF397)
MEDSSVERRQWRTSSYTGNGGGNCVEVSQAGSVVAVRDTKDRDGGTLAFNAAAWSTFLATVR